MHVDDEGACALYETIREDVAGLRLSIEAEAYFKEDLLLKGRQKFRTKNARIGFYDTLLATLKARAENFNGFHIKITMTCNDPNLDSFLRQPCKSLSIVFC